MPEATTFNRWIEQRFEAENPGIDLVLRDPAKAENADLAYDLDAATAALVRENGDDRQHLIEVDTMILGALVDAKAVRPFRSHRSDFFPFAQQAVEIGGVTYGVPHWTCGYFVMTPFADVAKARTASELRQRLARSGTPYPDLGGDIEGSWDSVIVYLDAYVDTYAQADPAEALDDDPLDPSVRAALREVGAACSQGGSVFCNREDDAQTPSDESMITPFSRGEVDALIGYSERLHRVLTAPGRTLRARDIRIASAPLGAGKRPFLFTDALVLSRNCADPVCEHAARRFAEFYVSTPVFEAALLGRDLGAAATPRYLLPSTSAALTARAVRAEPIYRQLQGIGRSAKPYPNRGVPEARARGEIRQAINAVLHTPRRNAAAAAR